MMSHGINSFSLNRIIAAIAILEAIESQLRRWCKGLKAWQRASGWQSLISTSSMSFFHCLREPLCLIPTYTDTYGFLVFPSISLPLVTWCAFVVPRCGQAAQTAGTKPRGPRCSPWLGCRQMCRSHPFLPHLWFAVLDNTQTVLSLSSLTKHEHPARPSRCLCLLQGDLALLADGVDSDVNSKWVVLVHFCSMSWYDQLKYFFRAVTQHASAILSPYDFGLFLVYFGLFLGSSTQHFCWFLDW